MKKLLIIIIISAQMVWLGCGDSSQTISQLQPSPQNESQKNSEEADISDIQIMVDRYSVKLFDPSQDLSKTKVRIKSSNFLDRKIKDHEATIVIMAPKKIDFNIETPANVEWKFYGHADGKLSSDSRLSHYFGTSPFSSDRGTKTITLFENEVCAISGTSEILITISRPTTQISYKINISFNYKDF